MSSTTIEDRQQQIADLNSKPKAGLMDRALCVQVNIRKPGKVKKVRTQVQVKRQPAASEPAVEVLFEGAPTEDTGTEAVSRINERVHTDLTKLRISKYVF